MIDQVEVNDYIEEIYKLKDEQAGNIEIMIYNSCMCILADTGYFEDVRLNDFIHALHENIYVLNDKEDNSNVLVITPDSFDKIKELYEDLNKDGN